MNANGAQSAVLWHLAGLGLYLAGCLAGHSRLRASRWFQSLDHQPRGAADGTASLLGRAGRASAWILVFLLASGLFVTALRIAAVYPAALPTDLLLSAAGVPAVIVILVGFWLLISIIAPWLLDRLYR